ncbi:MAG: DinB family protein [Candidatus Acidiferrales bacterium]|jgi:uncharacterized damage-inducible protein DinB
MKTLILAVLSACLLTIPAAAQTSEQAAPKDELSRWLLHAYTNTRNNLIKSAESFPDELYGMRPGPQKEVRNYGQIVGHVANFNYRWCSQAKGEKNPHEGNDLEKITTKAELVKALQDAFSYCDPVYAGMTDASGLEVIPITQENGRPAQVPRMSLLIQNHAHNNEHYGNLVTYMRIKGIVPPSSQRR